MTLPSRLIQRMQAATSSLATVVVLAMSGIATSCLDARLIRVQLIR
jgi:hypothetical protein